MIKHVGSVTPNKIIILLVSPLLLSASLLDFRELDQASKAVLEGNYTKAVNAYERVEKKSDEVIYDEANSYYKLKEYKKAKELYSSIQKESLAFNKWHNLGNTHAQLGEIDEGIKAYEEALKIKEDKDTRFNLELLKKKKKEQEKKKKDNKKDDKNKKKDDKNKKKEENKKNQDKKNKDSDNKEKEDEKKKKEQDKKDKAQKEKDKKKDDKSKDDKKKDDNKKKDNKNDKSDKEKQKAAAQMKKEPISDKELRKYQKMLDQRGINTLMVPLETKGDDNHELKPW